MRQTCIYVGLSDADTRDQRFETRKYVSVLKNVCLAYHVGFSVEGIRGGYFHEDGTFVEENSLKLTLLDADRDTIRQIAEDLCVFFRQESVLVTESEAASYFLKAGLDA